MVGYAVTGICIVNVFEGSHPNLAVIVSWLPWMVLVMVLDAPWDPLITAMLLYAVPAVMGLLKVIVIVWVFGMLVWPVVGVMLVTVSGADVLKVDV